MMQITISNNVHVLFDPADHTSVTLKLSGDGAKITANATMVFLTFSFLGLASDVLSAAGI